MWMREWHSPSSSSIATLVTIYLCTACSGVSSSSSLLSLRYTINLKKQQRRRKQWKKLVWQRSKLQSRRHSKPSRLQSNPDSMNRSWKQRESWRNNCTWISLPSSSKRMTKQKKQRRKRPLAMLIRRQLKPQKQRLRRTKINQSKRVNRSQMSLW